MKVYRCLICGDAYLGTEAPSRCPFCGADAELIVDTREFPEGDLHACDPNEQEKADLERAIQIELRNSRYYLGVSKRTGNDLLASAYKRLGKVESEHLEIFCKMLKVDEPAEAGTPLPGGETWCDDIAFSLAAEQEASAFYAEAAARAVDPRIKLVLDAVSAVEHDHIVLDHLLAGIAGCE